MASVRLAPLPLKTMFSLGTKVVFDEEAITVRLAAGVSASPTVKAIAGVGTSSLVVWSAMSEMVGGSFTALTVSTKMSLAVSDPSLTATVIVAVPD